jgi:hypothetical protein
MQVFDDIAKDMTAGYPDAPFRVRHRLAGDARFALPALLELSRRLPPELIEYNAGTAAIDQDPDQTPQTGLSIEETIRRIEECNSWMVLRHVERDPVYAAALEECLAEVAPHAAKATGKMHKKEGFIFISSANAVTPLHLDPEHNILLHLKGKKRMAIYPAESVPDEHHERFHVGRAHRNLRPRPEYESAAQIFDLEPGDGVFVPLKAPHWVRTGPEYSISFSVTWRSAASDREARLRVANHAVRILGGSPPPVGTRPLRDAAAAFAQRVAFRLGRKAGAAAERGYGPKT